MKPFSKKQLKADLKEYSNGETKDMNLWIIQHPDLMRSVIEASQKASSEEDLEVFIFSLLNPIAVDLGISTDVRWHELGYAWFNTTRGNWPMKEVDQPNSKNIDIENLPTFDKKQKLDELLEQLSAETDPIKQEKIKKHIEHVKRAKLLKAGKGYGEEAICPTCGEYKPTDFSPAELKEREWECLECETKRSKGEVPKDPGSEPISKYHPTYEFLVRLVKLLSKTIPEAIPEIKQLSLQHPFQTVADIEYLTTQIWNLATTKYNIPREWLIKKLPEKKASLNKHAMRNGWISPEGEDFPIEGEGHFEFVRDLYESNKLEVWDEYEEMKANGWTRVALGGTKNIADFTLDVHDLTRLPPYLDNFIAENFDGKGVDVGDTQERLVHISDPFPSIQKAVNKALRSPTKTADLNKKVENIEISTTYSRGKFPVLIDPTSEQMEELIQKSNYNELRYLEGKSGSTYVWDAYRSTHAEVANELHFKGFDVDENSPRGTFSDREVFASLNKKAYSEFWIDPNGKAYPQDSTTHADWVVDNSDMLDEDYGIKNMGRYGNWGDAVTINTELISRGWTRVTSPRFIKAQFLLHVDNFTHLNQLDDFIAKHFDPKSPLPIAIGTDKSHQLSIEDPFPSLEQAVAKALKQPVMSSFRNLNKKADNEPPCICGCKLKDHWFVGTSEEFCKYCAPDCMKYRPQTEKKADLSKVPKDIQDCYLYGKCMYLALALHELLNWSIEATTYTDDSNNEIIEHAWVKSPSGKTLDILGSDASESNTFSDSKVRNLTVEDIDKLLEGGIDSSEVKKAEEVAKKYLIPSLNMETNKKADLWPAQEQAGDMLSHDHNSLSYNPLQEPDTSVSGPNPNDIQTDAAWDIIVDKFFTHHERWSSVVKALKEANSSITDDDIKLLKERVKKSLDNQMGINASLNKKAFEDEGWWIDPNGKFYEVGMTHEDWAFENENFLEKNYGIRWTSSYPTVDLLNNGWVRIGDIGVGETGFGIELRDLNKIPQFVFDYLTSNLLKKDVVAIADEKNRFIELSVEELTSGQKAVNRALRSPVTAKHKLNIDKVIKILDSKEPKVVHVDTKNYKLELADGTSLTFDEAVKKAMEMDKEGVFSGAEFSTTEFNVNPTLDSGPFSSPEDHGAKPQKSPFPNSNWLPADDENKDEQPWSNIASNLNRPFSKKAYYSDVFNVVIHDSQIRQYFEDRGIDITKINQMLPDLDINYWNKNSPVQIGVNEESTIGQLEQENPGYKFGKQYAAYYQPSTKQIYVNPALTLSNARSTIIHELEHALQDSTGVLFPVEEWMNTPYDIRTHEWGAELSTIRSFKNKGYSLEQIFKFYLNKAKHAGGYPDSATELNEELKNKIEQLYELADEVEPQSVVSKKELNKQARYDQPYWIDPAGKEYKLSNDTHESWAENNQKLLKSKYGVDFIKMSKRDSASSFLMLNGWTRAAISETIIVFTKEDLNNLDVLDNFVAEHWEKDRFHYILLETISDQKSWQITEPFPSLASVKKDEVTSTGLGMYGSIKQASSIEDVNGVKVYVDPTWKQAVALLNNSKEKNLRGIVDPWTGGSLYIWDSYSLTHEDVIRALGLGIEPYPEEEEYSDLLSQMNDEAGLRWMFNMQQKVRNSSSKKKADALDEILKLVNETGGVTWNLSQGNMSGTNNYSVSIHPELSLILDHTPSKEELSEYIKANSANGDSIGVWKDSSSGKWYLDVVTTILNKEEAIELGRKHNQIAIWDLANNQEIPTGGTGKTAEDHLLTQDQQNQIASVSSPAYNLALNNYAEAVKRGHSKDRSVAYAVDSVKNLEKIDEKKLVELINTYLKGLI